MIDGNMINKDYTYPPEDYLYIPRRAPIDIIEHIKDMIKNNSCCEIGCASGYLLNYASKYNNHIIGVDFRRNSVEYCISQKYNVSLCDATKDKLPDVNLYYAWFGNYDIELNVIKNIQKKLKNKIFILFLSNSVASELKSKDRHINWCKNNDIQYKVENIIVYKERNSHWKNNMSCITFNL